MGVIAVMTILINGGTMPMLLGWLAITRPSPEKVEVLISVIREVEEYGERHLEHLKYDEILGDPDWDEVNKLTELDASQVLPDINQIQKVGAGFGVGAFCVVGMCFLDLLAICTARWRRAPTAVKCVCRLVGSYRCGLP